MYSTVLCCFFILLAVVSVISLTGKLILSAVGIEKNRSFYLNFGLEQIIGISFYTIFYAAYKTHGDTILLCLIPLFILLYVESRNKALLQASSLSFIKRLKEYLSFGPLLNSLELILILIFYFIWQVSSFISFRSGIPIECNADLHQASRMVDALNASGIERFYGGDISPSISTPTVPYHYYEYWFAALLSNLTFHLPLFAFKLILIPIFLLCLYTVVIYLIETLNLKLSFWLKLIASTFVFFRLPVFHNWLTPTVSFDVDNILGSGIAIEPLIYKSIHLQLIIIIALIFFIKDKPVSSILCMLIYLIVCYSALPIIVPSIFIFGAFGLILKAKIFSDNFFLKKWYSKINRTELFKILGYTFIVVVVFQLFYKLNSYSSIYVDADLHNDYTLSKLISYYSNTLNANQSFLPLGPALLGLIDILLPFVIFLSLIRFTKKERDFSGFKNSMWVFWISTVLFSLLFYLLFVFAYDHFVLYRITNLPVLSAISLFLLLKTFKEFEQKRFLKYIPIIFLSINLLLGIANNVRFEIQRRNFILRHTEVSYIKKIEHSIKGISPVGVCMFSEDSITKRNVKNEYNDSLCQTSVTQRILHCIYTPDLFLSYFKQNLIVHPITFTPTISDNFKGAIFKEALDSNNNYKWNRYYFYYMYCNNILKQKGLSETQKQISFIRYVKADYLIATRYAKIPAEIKLLVSDSVINNVNGERFFVLNRKLN